MGKSIKRMQANFAPFEGESNSSSSRHIRITRSMLKSTAWKSLKPIAVKLYAHLKLKYRNDGDITFTCTYKEIENEVGLGDRSAKAAFDDLIEHGFIEVVENNRSRMKANIYQFSDRWKQYGQPQNGTSIVPKPPRCTIKSGIP